MKALIKLLLFYTVHTLDYRALDEALIFESCKTRKCINVSIVNDAVNETEESFTFHLSRTIDLHPHITLDPVDGEILIVDDNTGETEPSECFLSN